MPLSLSDVIKKNKGGPQQIQYTPPATPWVVDTKVVPPGVYRLATLIGGTDMPPRWKVNPDGTTEYRKEPGGPWEVLYNDCGLETTYQTNGVILCPEEGIGAVQAVKVVNVGHDSWEQKARSRMNSNLRDVFG
jgi:hypothetical protein